MKNSFFINDASLIWPERVCPSTWLEHIPFSFWITSVLKPARIVELGTYYGGSYFSFCQAVECYHFNTKCFAIDTWKGDEQSGMYEDTVFQSVLEYNQKKYSSFSTLIRSTFDEALTYFEDGSIDLLHIDGFHTYAEVKKDYESWKPKLTENAIVLFHDINVKERNFGVCKLWDEIKEDNRYFEFFHGCGLGVLGLGNQFPPEIERLFKLTKKDKLTEFIRKYYHRLGSGINYLYLYEKSVSHSQI